MQKKIHPKWHDDAKVVCSCGNEFTTGSTEAKIEVDICSECHPFFTGEMKFVDRQGRVDKFKKKVKLAQQQQKKEAAKQKQAKQEEKQEEQKSYQQILREKRAELQTSKSE